MFFLDGRHRAIIPFARMLRGLVFGRLLYFEDATIRPSFDGNQFTTYFDVMSSGAKSVRNWFSVHVSNEHEHIAVDMLPSYL